MDRPRGSLLPIRRDMTTLDREELIEQAYFFRTYRERLEDNQPAQEILLTLREEILATTRLPMALEFLYGEMRHRGRISDGMQHLKHYFTPFQTFVITRAEEDKAKFDLAVALLILEREAEYKADAPTAAGLFVYQFECLARNRLGYDKGLKAVAEDPFYDDSWQKWIAGVSRHLGTREFSDFIFFHSQHYVDLERRRLRDEEWQVAQPILFDAPAGRIAKANRGKDPLYMFAALQRQLNYPQVPRARPKSELPDIPPALQVVLQRLEKRIQFLEMEANNTLDLSKFYTDQPPDFKKFDEPEA